MTYATQADLENFLGAGELEDLTPELIEMSLAAADEEINGRLSERYAVPIAEPIPFLVKSIAVEIARYRLHGSVGRPYNESLDAAINGRYQRALKRLEELANGSLKLSSTSNIDLPQFAPTSPKRGWDSF